MLPSRQEVDVHRRVPIAEFYAPAPRAVKARRRLLSSRRPSTIEPRTRHVTTPHAISRDTRADLVIVGGGIGGAVLALLSAAKGRRVVVLDRQAAGPSDPNRGEIVQPNGLKILDRLGLLDGLPADGISRVRRYHFSRIGGSRLVTVDYGSLPEPYNYTLVGHPSALMSSVRSRLAASPLIDVRWGARVVGLVRERRTVVGVEADIGGVRTLVRAAIVVGGDGSASAVRAALRIPSRVRRYADGYLTFVLPRPPAFGDDGRYYVGRREILGVFPLGPASIYGFYLWPAGQRESLEARGLAAFTSRLAEIDPDLRPVLGALAGWDGIGWMPCLKVVPRAWVADGAVLLGDAAHALNPHVAQGRNQALEDAVVLDAVLDSCFLTENFSRRALALYERLRRPRAAVLQRLGDEMAFFWNTGNPIVARLRDRVFATLERKDDLRRKMLTLVAGLSDRPFSPWDRVRALGWPR
jgi:2-polyprenyl-6-methoxyphenol hydroxylase-like FAD-dependent oxidoreductase